MTPRFFTCDGCGGRIEPDQSGHVAYTAGSTAPPSICHATEACSPARPRTSAALLNARRAPVGTLLNWQRSTGGTLDSAARYLQQVAFIEGR
jgi:hypothetical protein